MVKRTVKPCWKSCFCWFAPLVIAPNLLTSGRRSKFKTPDSVLTEKFGWEQIQIYYGLTMMEAHDLCFLICATFRYHSQRTCHIPTSVCRWCITLYLCLIFFCLQFALQGSGLAQMCFLLVFLSTSGNNLCFTSTTIKNHIFAIKRLLPKNSCDPFCRANQTLNLDLIVCPGPSVSHPQRHSPGHPYHGSHLRLCRHLSR